MKEETRKNTGSLFKAAGKHFKSVAYYLRVYCHKIVWFLTGFAAVSSDERIVWGMDVALFVFLRIKAMSGRS